MITDTERFINEISDHDSLHIKKRNCFKAKLLYLRKVKSLVEAQILDSGSTYGETDEGYTLFTYQLDMPNFNTLTLQDTITYLYEKIEKEKKPDALRWTEVILGPLITLLVCIIALMYGR